MNASESIPDTGFIPVQASLADLAGAEYVEAAVEAAAGLSGRPAGDLKKLAFEQIL